MKLNKSRAIFLDRDGTLNADSVDYIKNKAELAIFDFTPRAMQIFKNLGFKIILITNQSAIGRGITTREAVDEIHRELQRQLAKQGGTIDGFYYCPHTPEEQCNCRKPKTGNISQAVSDFNLDVAASYFIGDSEKDVQTGAAAGCKTVLVRTGLKPPSEEAIRSWTIQPDLVTENILQAALKIEDLERGQSL
jgi:D-glycero-D-manno-heptose 1,7-bisphosphate phosphatase